MQPPNAMLDKIAQLWAADTTSLASATANKIHLAMAAFVPSPTLLLAGLTEATFGGYAALNAGIGTQLEFIDPLTGNRTIEILAPAGGLHWATTTLLNLPQTIYGVYLSDSGNTVLVGSMLLPTPIPLSVIGQGLDAPALRFVFSNLSPA